MNLRFKDVVKHNRLFFSPAVVYDISDEVSCDYFVAMGWADETTDPADFAIEGDEVAVESDVVHGHGPSKGLPVLGS